MNARCMSQEIRSEYGAPDFHDQLVDCLPHLLAFATVLTRDRQRANDLVQDAVVKALNASEQFKPGTNFKAWMFTILRNHHFTNIRKHKLWAGYVDEVRRGNRMVQPAQEDNLLLAEIEKIVMAMPETQREALMLVTANGFSYEQAAEVCGCALGTIKSRVSRARQELRRVLLEDELPLSHYQREDGLASSNGHDGECGMDGSYGCHNAVMRLRD